MLMVANVIKRGSKFFASEQKTILSAAFVIGLIYAFSAFLGFIRNRLLSGYFGDSAELGVYFAADTIPSLIFSLLVAGSLSAAFIPVFSKIYRTSKDQAWEMSSGVFNVTLVFLAIFGVIVIYESDFIVRNILAVNTPLTESELVLMANLMRVMMIAQIALIVSSIFTSILQSFNRFIVPALAPVVYNFGVIIFLILFYDKYGIYAPAYGMIFGSVLHLIIQIPLVVGVGYRYTKSAGIRTNGVKEVYKLMIPRTLGQAAHKFLSPFYTNLALFISVPSNVIWNFGFAIQNLPIRVIGMATGQAALPILSKAATEDDLTSYKKLMIDTLNQVIFLVLPLSVLFFVLRVPLVRLAVGARKYSWEATIMTSYTLGFLTFSMVAQTLILILARGFYALHNTVIPVLIGLFSVITNGILAWIFVKNLGLGVWSIGLAYTIGSILDALLLFIFLNKRVDGFNLSEFIDGINKMLIASLITGLALYIPLKVLDQLVFDTTRTLGLIFLSAIVSVIGLVTYLLISKLLGVKELRIVYYFWDKIKKRRLISESLK